MSAILCTTSSNLDYGEKQSVVMCKAAPVAYSEAPSLTFWRPEQNQETPQSDGATVRIRNTRF